MNKYENIYVDQDAILGDLGFLLVKFYAIFFYEVCRDRRLRDFAKILAVTVSLFSLPGVIFPC